MTQLKETREVTQETKAQCHHFWTIDSAGGPTSKGRCKRCGMAKDFFNSFPEETAPAPKASVLGLPEIAELEVEPQSNS